MATAGLSTQDKMRVGLLQRDRVRLVASGASTEELKAHDAKITALKAKANTPLVEARETKAANILAADFDAKYGKHPAFAELDAILTAAAAQAPTPERSSAQKMRDGLAARQRSGGRP